VTGRLALIAAALLVSAGASAQGNVRPIDETVADLVYGLCPLFLAGQIPLGDARLVDRGFSAKVETAAGTRFGEIQVVKASLNDGEITFGGAPGTVCGVTAEGAKTDAVMAVLKKNMSFAGLHFQPVADTSGAPPSIRVETFRAPVDNRFLYLQLLRTEMPKPIISAQLFAMDK
jgi:hypothetical protein